MNDNTSEKQNWKGIGPDSEPPVQLTRSRKVRREADMTSMVDVTFLLLIFFMVTASFTVQKALAAPPSLSDHPSPNWKKLEEASRVVQIHIDQFNTFVLSGAGVGEVEAPSDQELRVQLNDLRKSIDADRVVILADSEAWHEKVVTAWDAANAAGFQEIRIGMSD